MPHSYRSLLGGLLLAPLLPLAARAQTNFQPGYVVRPAGDTLRGEIDARDAYFNATQCHFRPAAGAEATLYRPAELRAYGVEGRAYRALTPPGNGAKPVFAEVLVSGPASLYQTRDEHDGHFYLEAPQFALTELKTQRLLLPGRSDYQEQPVYRTTLAQALPSCPAAERQLPQLALSATALTRVVRAFNECQGVVTARPASRPGQRPRVGVLLGGQLIAMALTHPGTFPGQSVTATPPTVAAPAAGAYLSLPIGAVSRKLSVELSLLYARQQYDFGAGSNATYGSARQQYSFAQSWLRLPVLLRFVPLPQARVRPVLEAGFGLAYAPVLEATLITTDYNQRTTTQPFFAGNQRRFQESLAAGAGVQGNYWQGRRATALLRFEADNGWTTGQGLNTSANRYYLLLGFDLTK